MATVLAADLGGTKTLVRLARPSQAGTRFETLFEQRFVSAEHASLDELLALFLSTAQAKGIAGLPASACIAVAGPVSEAASKQTAKVTNLPWQLCSDELERKTGIATIKLINDFVAVGYAVAMSERPDDNVIYAAKHVAPPGSPRVVLGAGTGLGVCQIYYPQAGTPLICASEGGHMDFAPQDEFQFRFQRYMAQRYGHVSYDRIVAGPGIRDAFAFIAAEAQQSQDPTVRAILDAPDPAAAVSAGAGSNVLCKSAIDLFFAIYGAVAGNLALLALPFGGVFLGGGITPKLAKELPNSPFMRAYLEKGRLSHVVENVPVYLINDATIGLSGATHVALGLAQMP